MATETDTRRIMVEGEKWINALLELAVTRGDVTRNGPCEVAIVNYLIEVEKMAERVERPGQTPDEALSMGDR